MKSIRNLIVVAAFLASGVAMTAEPEYRLAGIIAPANGNALALIELPDGEQRLFREGDALGDGQVTEIQQTGVRLEFPSGDLLLELTGTGLIVVDEPRDYRREDYRATGTHQVPASRLREISRLAETPEEQEAKDFALRVMNHLNLPAAARITAVADEPVSSMGEAVKAMAQRIEENGSEAAGFQFVLSISDASGNKRVYILTDGAEVTDQTVLAN